jgi:hypothetical protein
MRFLCVFCFLLYVRVALFAIDQTTLQPMATTEIKRWVGVYKASVESFIDGLYLASLCHPDMCLPWLQVFGEEGRDKQ